MNRIDLLNSLIQQRNCQRYLEISMHSEQESYNRICCPFKQKKGVDFTKNSQTALDHSFAGTMAEKFEVIFIDGLHTEEQVLKDVRDAFDCLAPNGIIVLHDCMPPDAWHQREPEEYEVGEIGMERFGKRRCEYSMQRLISVG